MPSELFRAFVSFSGFNLPYLPLRLEDLEGCLAFPGVLCMLACRRRRNAGSGSGLLRSRQHCSEALPATASYWKQDFMISTHASAVHTTSYSCRHCPIVRSTLLPLKTCLDVIP